MKLRLTLYVSGEQFFAIRKEMAELLHTKHITAELVIQPIKDQVCLTFTTTDQCMMIQEHFEGRL